MTNLIATLSLITITNWTGVNFQNKELGYVATNHMANVAYDGSTNQFLLKTIPSDKAVWRDAPPTGYVPNIIYSPIQNWPYIKGL
jgi:hypothetical protein